MNIREACIDDCPDIIRLAKNELGCSCESEVTNKKFSAVLKDESQKIYVAVANNTVIGFIHLEEYGFLFMPHVKNVLGLAVSSAFHRKGVGRLLLQKGEEWALMNGCQGIRLNSGSERHNAHQFYKAMGYEAQKEQIRFAKKFKGGE